MSCPRVPPPNNTGIQARVIITTRGYYKNLQQGYCCDAGGEFEEGRAAGKDMDTANNTANVNVISLRANEFYMGKICRGKVVKVLVASWLKHL